MNISLHELAQTIFEFRLDYLSCQYGDFIIERPAYSQGNHLQKIINVPNNAMMLIERSGTYPNFIYEMLVSANFDAYRIVDLYHLACSEQSLNNELALRASINEALNIINFNAQG